MDGFKGNEKWMKKWRQELNNLVLDSRRKKKGLISKKRTRILEYERVCTVRRRKHSGRLKVRTETSLVSEMPNERPRGSFVRNYLKNTVKRFFKMLRIQQAVFDLLAAVALEKSLQVFEHPAIARRAIKTESFRRSDLLQFVDFNFRMCACDNEKDLLG